MRFTDAERDAIHRHLAHLTWARVEEGQQEWEFTGMVQATFGAYGRFVEHAEEQQIREDRIFRACLQAALIEMEEITDPFDATVHYSAASTTDLVVRVTEFPPPLPGA